MPGGTKSEPPKWQPFPRLDVPDDVYLLQPKERDVKVVSAWVKDENCVLMCQSVEDLRELAKKGVG
eukprot:1395808-Amphidinium_carterae.1